MIYLVHGTIATEVTLEVEARNRDETISQAGDLNYIGKDEWDSNLIAVATVEKKGGRDA